MNENDMTCGSLVLFKNKAALVQDKADKITIATDNGSIKKVRPKDIQLLHPGPLSSLGNLERSDGNVLDAWEMIQGETVSLEDLSELVFDAFTPVTAWSTWQLVDEGRYFKGTIEAIEAIDEQTIAAADKERKEREAKEQRWAESLERIRTGSVSEEDESSLKEVEKLAYGKSQASKVMRELKMEQTAEKAHKLLLKLGRWNEQTNPYPTRFECFTENPEMDIPELADENRFDLTHLKAFAIDDAGSSDPDDAISIDGDVLWVHVADAAALIKSGSELDANAQARGSNLYIPEGCVHMLPQSVTDQLGLGLQETSPALSFGITFNADMSIADVEIKPSWVKVTRTTYEEVNEMLDQQDFAPIVELTSRFEKRRIENGASSVDMPEVKIKVDDDGVVSIRPLPRFESREMVTNAMLMTGEAVALFCEKNGIPIPYVTQAPPEEFESGDDLATHFANIRKFNKSEVKVSSDYHAGLGMDVYARTTSPLRRYADLLVHQQLRAFISGEQVLTEDDVLEKISESQCAADAVRLAERESNKHWSLVYLMQNPEWSGKAVLVDKRDNRGTWIIPELNMQTKLSLKTDMPLNSEVDLKVNRIELAELISRFRMV